MQADVTTCQLEFPDRKIFDFVFQVNELVLSYHNLLQNHFFAPIFCLFLSP